MNTALKKHEPVINHQNPETPTSGSSHTTSVQIMRTILVVLAVTVLAVFATWLKFQTEQKYLNLEKMTEKNLDMDEQIRLLEAEVEGMLSYERIDQMLRENNIEVYPPERAFHIKLTGENEPVANAERKGNSPRGKI